jgi:prlF antitoxin for toxin YhaV_toxin
VSAATPPSTVRKVAIVTGPATGSEVPVLGDVLGFLADDMAHNPSQLRALDKGLAERVRILVSGVKFDLDSPLSSDDE